MKAWVLYGINDFRFADVPKPTPKNGEVLVKVKAAGICSSDIQRVYCTGVYKYPIILGHELAGTTSDGIRVGVFPLLPCFNCESCKQNHYETCSDYSYIGSRQNGAFAEYVAVPRWNLIELPNSVSFEQAALLEPAAVALHAVKRLNFNGVSSVAIIGNGTIGRLITKWLAIFEIDSVVVLGRDDKPSLDHYDACIEAVGSVAAFRSCIELTKPNGQLVLVGNPNADFNIDQKLYWQILRKQITIHGSWNSSYPTDWQSVLDNMDKLQLDNFISHKYKFDELDKAFEIIHGKREKYGKIIATSTP